MSGWIRLYRKTAEHEFWEEPRVFSRAEAWLWLLLQAKWKREKVIVGSKVIWCERGEMAFALRYLATAWGWPVAKVQRFLAILRLGTMIETKVDRGCTQIRIANYERYQSDNGGSDTETDTRSDTETDTETDTNTKKKETRSKNKKIINSPGDEFENGKS